MHLCTALPLLTFYPNVFVESAGESGIDCLLLLEVSPACLFVVSRLGLLSLCVLVVPCCMVVFMDATGLVLELYFLMSPLLDGPAFLVLAWVSVSCLLPFLPVSVAHCW